MTNDCVTEDEARRDKMCLVSPFTIKELIRWLNVAEDKMELTPEKLQRLQPFVDEFNRESDSFQMTPRKLAAVFGLIVKSQDTEEHKNDLEFILYVFLQMPAHIQNEVVVDIEKRTVSFTRRARGNKKAGKSQGSGNRVRNRKSGAGS